MDTGNPLGAGRKLPAMKRKAVPLSREQWYVAEPLSHGATMPLQISPSVEEVDLPDCVGRDKETVEALLRKHGALLFRGFRVGSAHEFERLIASTSGEWAEYREAATPRTQVSGPIHTSTEYPADQTIFLHNENSHCDSWPLKIFFFCVTPPERGGETPIADCRRVYQRIDPRIRDRFAARKVMYVRNFGAGLGFSWQTVFKTTEEAEVERYCRAAGIETEWREGGRLRIRYVREAVARHPRTGETVWFNHGTFFNKSNIEPGIREALLAEFSEDELPYNTYYGDGAEIEDSVLDELREAYRQETVAFPWAKSDVLMLDNMLVAHGRAPFAGPRKILVGMNEPYGITQTQHPAQR